MKTSSTVGTIGDQMVTSQRQSRLMARICQPRLVDDLEVDMDRDQPIRAVERAHHGIRPVAPTRMNDHDVFTVPRTGQDDVGDPRSDLVGIVHLVEPAIGPVVFEQALIPVLGRRHAVGDRPVVHETGGAGIDRPKMLRMVKEKLAKERKIVL